MSFAELRQHVLENTLLATNYFAEEGSYVPHGGSSRRVNCHVRFRRQTTTNDGTRDEQEIIEVLVGRDPTNQTIGGIDRPQSGERFYRSPSRDPDCRPYTFTGEILDEAANKWRLVFSRRRRTAQGRGK